MSDMIIKKHQNSTGIDIELSITQYSKLIKLLHYYYFRKLFFNHFKNTVIMLNLRSLVFPRNPLINTYAFYSSITVRTPVFLHSGNVRDNQGANKKVLDPIFINN